MFSDIRGLRSKAMSAAQSFIGTKNALDVLGWGVSGFVFLSPDLMTAIKVHHNSDGFHTEVKAYELLRRHRITQIDGITIPKLRKADFDRGLIQIDFVSPPYLLDFAGVRFSDPEFPSETVREIHEDIQLRFGRNAPIAYAVQHRLLQIGMYYLDLRPSNLNLQGLAGVDLSDEEEPA
jgi:hypothetical protein